MSSAPVRDAKEVAALRKELGASNLLEEAESICRQFRVTLDGVLSGKRTKALANARSAMCSAFRKYDLSYPEIGKLLGMDHTSARDAAIRWGQRERQNV